MAGSKNEGSNTHGASPANDQTAQVQGQVDEVVEIMQG